MQVSKVRGCEIDLLVPFVRTKRDPKQSPTRICRHERTLPGRPMSRKKIYCLVLPARASMQDVSFPERSQHSVATWFFVD